MQQIKAITATGEWLLDVLGVPFGGPYGGRDAQGEYFTPATDLWLERIPKRPIVYYHGLAEENAIPQIIGEEIGWEEREDGIWFQVLLDPASRLARRVWEAAQKGLARASSGAIAHLVRVATSGHILVWPMAELSLLDASEHQPANPYAVALPQVKAAFEAAGLPGAEAFGDGSEQFTVNSEQSKEEGDEGREMRDEDDSLLITQHSELETFNLEEDRDFMEEKTLRNIIRQEVGTALADFADEPAPGAMFLTGQAPAVIRERGEQPLSANGTPFVDAIKALRQGRFDVVTFQLAGKALSEGTNSAGGYLVPVEYSSTLIELLRARAAVRAAGATVIPMSNDILSIPSQTGGATAYWVAENAQITASDQTWGQVQLQAKKLAALTKLSAELFEDSDPQIERLVMDDLARVLALEEDIKYLRGDGTSNTPTGLENIPGVTVDTTTLGANGGTPTLDNLANMLYALDGANVPGDGRGWIVHPRTVNTLRKIKDGQNRYLWADPASPGDPPTVWGYPVFTCTGILFPLS